ncbi:MAG: hypothetical protein GF308_11110 [Candidatus Heimdallarchaeota archaeon]|nr:hypothetical protein [Candidatus Heimdallarchaeota archaeon]
MNDQFEFDDETNCLYQILKKEDNLSSSQILEMAASDEFEKICTGCVSGDSFLRAVKKLEKAGIVKSKLAKGGYKWRLLKKDLQ